MKVKFLIAATLLVTSIITFAEDGKGYRIISEKFTSTPGASGYIISTLSDKKSLIITDSNIKAHAFAPNQLGCPSKFNKVMGFHEIKIRNVTDKIQRFSYIYSLSVEDARNYFERNIELDPQGYYHDASEDYLAFQRPDVEKRYEILVDTKISGDGKDTSSYVGYLNLWFRLCK